MTQLREVVLAAPVRTAIGTFGGSLKDMPAPDLGAVAIGMPLSGSPADFGKHHHIGEKGSVKEFLGSFQLFLEAMNKVISPVTLISPPVQTK